MAVKFRLFEVDAEGLLREVDPERAAKLHAAGRLVGTAGPW